MDELSSAYDASRGNAEMAIARTIMVVTAYVGSNPVSRTDLPALIGEVHKAVIGLGSPIVEPSPDLVPAVPIRKSVDPDFIVCLEDGLRFKSLKRHLRTRYNMTPEEYRERWNLPADYPMVSANYSATRSRLAKDHGLGRKA